MKKVFEFASEQQRSEIALSVLLPFDDRKKSRLKTESEQGEALGFMLPRGQILRHGTLLVDELGRVIEVKAAQETVSVVESQDTHLLLRAAYHLGNRHVPLQVGNHRLLYQHDHVLDDMVKGLGLSVSVQQQPFEPEDGAYAPGTGHHHGHHHEH